MIRAMTAARTALAVFLFVACGSALAAKPAFKEKPWKGWGSGTTLVTADGFEIVFSGNLTLLGKYVADGEHFWHGNSFGGAGTMIGANRDELDILYQATRVDASLPFTFRGTIKVMGGTGRWVGATGSAAMVGTDDGTGVFTFELDGMIISAD